MNEVYPNRERTITRLLRRWSVGDEEAIESLIPLVYAELRRIAGGYVRRGIQQPTLEATVLVHEAYLRLFGREPVRCNDRSHFLGVAARVMRQVIVDYLRERQAAKRGGGKPHLTLSAAGRQLHNQPDLLALDDALKDLAEIDPQSAMVVELRFFGGLSIAETADYLDISPKTVVRQWRRAKAWLYGQLKAEG